MGGSPDGIAAAGGSTGGDSLSSSRASSEAAYASRLLAAMASSISAASLRAATAFSRRALRSSLAAIDHRLSPDRHRTWPAWGGSFTLETQQKPYPFYHNGDW